MDTPAVDEANLNSVQLKGCRTCGRTFHPISLERHEKVCEKTKTSRGRNVFNSFLQRSKEITSFPNVKKDENKPRSKSKENSDRIRTPKPNILNNGSSPQSITPFGYVQCPTCHRNFSQKAAERHMSWCREQQSRMPKSSQNAVALERLNARIKYRAPLPCKKDNKDGRRLIKSAESLRVHSILRTHSSPPVPGRSSMSVKFNASCDNLNTLRGNDSKQSLSFGSPIHSSKHCLSSPNIVEPQKKRSVKFKEKFPDYEEQRTTTVNMLKSLKLQLSKLDTSDNHSQDNFYGSLNEKYFDDDMNNFSSEIKSGSPSSESELCCITSSSSENSLPCISKESNTEKRMPRFCYNCGTKYPMVSAKFCCECGVRRLVFGADNNLVLVS